MSLVADPCGLLGVAPGSSEKEINAAYRRASLRCHPDRCPGDPEAAAKFAKLNEAKDMLIRQAQAIASCFAAPAQQEQRRPWQSSWSFSVGGSAGSTASAPSRATPPPATAATTVPQGGGDFWAELQAKARAQAHAEAEQQAAKSRLRRASAAAAAHAAARDSSPTASASSAPPSKKVRAAVTAEEQGGNDTHTVGGASIGGANVPPKCGAAVRGAARPLVTPERVSSELQTAASGGGRGVAPKSKPKPATAARSAKPKPAVQKKGKEDVSAAGSQKAKRKRAGHESEDEGEQEEVVAGAVQGAVAEGDQENADPDDGVEEEDEEMVDEAEEEEEDIAEEDENAKPSMRLRLKGEDPLDWVGQLLAAGPCEDPGTTQEVRDMVADMWSNVLAEVRQHSAQLLHEYHIRAARMVSKTLSRYRDALAQNAEVAASASRAAAADETGRAAELASALETAKAAREAQLHEIASSRASLEASKQLLARSRSAEKATSEEAESATAAERASETKKCSTQRALEHFEKLESAGPPAKPAELKQAAKEVEALMGKARASEMLMANVLKRVLPALKLKPAERERFDEAALSAVEGCLRAHVKECADQAAAAARGAIAARARSTRAQEEVASAKFCVEDSAAALKQAKTELRMRTSELRKASQASRRYGFHVRALAAEAQACVEALSETDRACESLEAVISCAAAEQEQSVSKNR